jgi:hypothetical protein
VIHIIIAKQPRNINTGEASDFKIYPNPAIEYLKVGLSYYGNFEIQIFDVMGRNIFLESVETDEITDISNIHNGTYFVILKQIN